MSARKRERNVKLGFEALRRDLSGTLPGVVPATLRDLLQREADKPMRAGNAELPRTSIFGDSHKQREMF